jgi:hypothetical protein
LSAAGINLATKIVVFALRVALVDQTTIFMEAAAANDANTQAVEVEAVSENINSVIYNQFIMHKYVGQQANKTVKAVEDQVNDTQKIIIEQGANTRTVVTAAAGEPLTGSHIRYVPVPACLPA